MSQQATGPVGDSSGSRWTDRSNPGSVAIGAVLVVLGALFLIQQITGFDVWRWTWPAIVVGGGVVLFAGMLFGGRNASGLAIPASIVTMTGLILLYQNTLNAWQTWAYAWALIAPTSIGIGMWLMGWWGQQPSSVRIGRQMTRIGVGLFVAFAAFFELVLNLSGLVPRGFGGVAVAVVLIGIGACLLVRGGDRVPGWKR